MISTKHLGADGQTQNKLMEACGIPRTLPRLGTTSRQSAHNFDRLVMSGGVQEQGRFAELDHKASLASLLMAAE